MRNKHHQWSEEYEDDYLSPANHLILYTEKDPPPITDCISDQSKMECMDMTP
jgi:hypothetical protein